MQELSRSAEDLALLAGEMKAVVDKFRLDETVTDGSGSAELGAHPDKSDKRLDIGTGPKDSALV